ncbi:MAG: DUF3618 domain-containing protein [Actinomycetes bacterium]|nr:DUF3618 domain-containing protein [Solirubrobacterales bacterium]
MSGRTPEEIRASIESGRAELAVSIRELRGEVVRFSDWRGKLNEHRPEALAVAAVTGFVLAGGIAGVSGVLFGRRRRRRGR